MGRITEPKPVKLIVGFIFSDEKYLVKAKEILKRRFGRPDFDSQILEFTHTDYYCAELGNNLKRNFISFKRLIGPQELWKIKQLTNRIESSFSNKGRRRINIDPGYIDMAKLVLASTKDYRHRIYLNKGIYAEITLYYQAGSFKSWNWTYPDYATSLYLDIFNKIRSLYAEQLKGD